MATLEAAHSSAPSFYLLMGKSLCFCFFEQTERLRKKGKNMTFTHKCIVKRLSLHYLSQLMLNDTAVSIPSFPLSSFYFNICGDHFRHIDSMKTRVQRNMSIVCAPPSHATVWYSVSFPQTLRERQEREGKNESSRNRNLRDCMCVCVCVLERRTEGGRESVKG